MLKEYLTHVDPKKRGTLADRLIEKYYKLAMDGDPIIMRDLINRIDGLPKQVIASDRDNPVNINIITSLFGQAVRTNAKPTTYDGVTLDDTDDPE